MLGFLRFRESGISTNTLQNNCIATVIIVLIVGIPIDDEHFFSQIFI